MARGGEEFWVFGYGSLMWRPDFPFAERAPATVFGVHRSLCVFSHIHRGTPERPGLVLGLDAGGACRGVAFRVRDADREEVEERLRVREQATRAYLEMNRRARLAKGGRDVVARCYVIDRDHAQYAGGLSLEQQVALVRQGQGKSGAAADYVLNTVRHLRELGIRDAHLEQLAARL